MHNSPKVPERLLPRSIPRFNPEKVRNNVIELFSERDVPLNPEIEKYFIGGVFLCRNPENKKDFQIVYPQSDLLSNSEIVVRDREGKIFSVPQELLHDVIPGAIVFVADQVLTGKYKRGARVILISQQENGFAEGFFWKPTGAKIDREIDPATSILIGYAHGL